MPVGTGQTKPKLPATRRSRKRQARHALDSASPSGSSVPSLVATRRQVFLNFTQFESRWIILSVLARQVLNCIFHVFRLAQAAQSTERIHRCPTLGNVGGEGFVADVDHYLY